MSEIGLSKKIELFARIDSGKLILVPSTEGQIDYITGRSSNKIVNTLRRDCCEKCELCSGVTDIERNSLVTKDGPVNELIDLDLCGIPGTTVRAPAFTVIMKK